MNQLQPGAVADFVHLHTNRVRACQPERPKGMEIVTVEAQTKIRAMLVIQVGTDPSWGIHYLVVYMTSVRKYLGEPSVVLNGWLRNGRPSLIDCSKVFDYSEVLRVPSRRPPEKVSLAVWRRVREEVPRAYRSFLSDGIIRKNG